MKQAVVPQRSSPSSALTQSPAQALHVPASELNDLSGKIIGAAMKVHSALGPGLLEGAYKTCLVHELRRLGLRVETEAAVPIEYDGQRIEAGYRLDVLVEDAVVVELKAVDKVLPIHGMQLLTYLRLSGKRLGLLINFNVQHLRDGIQRVVNNL